MLFQRRIPETIWQKVRNLLWPRMGFRRTFDYYKHRSVRIPDSEYSIAAGMAFGCLISWTPTFGFHLIQCAIFNWITRTSFIAAFIGSAFGNLWTTPFLMYIAYQAGKVLFTMFGYGDYVLHYDGPITEELLMDNKMKIFLPTLVGGYFVGIVTYPLFYYPFYYMVKGARLARLARIEQKLHHEAQDITGQAQ